MSRRLLAPVLLLAGLAQLGPRFVGWGLRPGRPRELTPATRAATGFFVGDVVELLHEGDGRWVEAVVKKENDDGSLSVVYDDRDHEYHRRTDFFRVLSPRASLVSSPSAAQEKPKPARSKQALGPGDDLSEWKGVSKDTWHRAKVITILPYGIMVTLKSPSGQLCRGLVHVSNIHSFGSVVDINDEAKVGQTVLVRVLSAGSKLSLSMANITSHKEVVASLQSLDQDQWLEGTVTGIVPFGIFVSVKAPDGGNAIQGLVPHGELSNDEFVHDLQEIASVGESVRVRVVRSEKEEDSRLALSMRERRDLSAFEDLGQDEWLEGEVKSLSKTLGAKVAVRPSSIGDPVVGWVHISQVTDDILEDIHECLQVGQRVSARVLSAVDGELYLSMRPLCDWTAFQGLPEDQELTGYVR